LTRTIEPTTISLAPLKWLSVALTQSVFSGHSLKYLLAAAGCFSVLVMLKTRSPTNNERAP
jgi:pheromone shutdown protein TraB